MKTVPCHLCKTPTEFTGTKLCNRCWELHRRVESDPKLTLRIQYELSPVREQFESPDGVTALYYNPEPNFQVVQIVNIAYLLEIPVEILRILQYELIWSRLETSPTNFRDFTYRKARS